MANSKFVGLRFDSFSKLIGRWLAGSVVLLCFRLSGAEELPQPRPMSELRPVAVFPVSGDPDWVTVTDRAVWVTSDRRNRVVRLNPKTNKPDLEIEVKEPCSGLGVGFGSIWVPSCGEHALIRVNEVTGKRQAVIPASPADSEGGVTTGAGSVWLATSAKGELTRVDALTNRVVARIQIPAGSFNPLFATGAVWVTCHACSSLVRVDPATNRVTDVIPVGPQPRFLTVGAGAIWILNQGDGSVSRVDLQTHKMVKMIAAGIPGHGGDIAFGTGAVWATMIGTPLTRIDPSMSRVTAQWKGAGGDSVRVENGAIWLTDLRGERVLRIAVPAN